MFSDNEIDYEDFDDDDRDDESTPPGPAAWYQELADRAMKLREERDDRRAGKPRKEPARDRDND